MTTMHGTERVVNTTNHYTLPGSGEDTRSLYATTNHTSRGMKKVKYMYRPRKHKRLEVNEKDLIMKVRCVTTIDQVIEDQKLESDIELNKRIRKELTCKTTRFSEKSLQQYSEAFNQYSQGNSRTNFLCD